MVKAKKVMKEAVPLVDRTIDLREDRGGSPLEKSLLMVYEGHVESGRDQGYPQIEYVVIESREELVDRYVNGCDLYECTPVDVEKTLAEAKTAIRLAKEQRAAESEEAEKAARRKKWLELNKEFSTANGD